MYNVKVSVVKSFDGLLVPGEEIELEFQGKVFPGCVDTYENPGEAPEFSIEKVFLVANGKTTDKEVKIPDDLFDKIYPELLDCALMEAEEKMTEREPEYEPDDDFDPRD